MAECRFFHYLPNILYRQQAELANSGEAYFSGPSDKAKPFVVSANGLKVAVVGTEFNVMAYGDEDAGLCTTLVSGVVKAFNTGGQELTLQPGQQATLERQSGQ